jgi:hypothetical protein
MNAALHDIFPEGETKFTIALLRDWRSFAYCLFHSRHLPQNGTSNTCIRPRT